MQLRYLAPRFSQADRPAPKTSSLEDNPARAGDAATPRDRRSVLNTIAAASPAAPPKLWEAPRRMETTPTAISAAPRPAAGEHAGAPPAGAPDPREILDSIGETIYDWDFQSDRIQWGPNAAAVLGFDDIERIGTGRAFAECLSHDSESSRYEAIRRAASDGAGSGDVAGAAFRVCYGLISPDRPRDAIVWVEDTGRWFAGADGLPARAHGLVRVITDRYQNDRMLAFKARFDPLTGVLNRISLLEQAALMYARAGKSRQSFGALLIGLDNLFMLNRSFGYDIADQVIAELARRLRSLCRERDLVARYAGNKFALLLENCDTAELKAAGERLIEAAAAPVDTPAGPAPVSLRMAGVVAPRHGRTPHLLFQHAEEALDMARRPGAPRFFAYEPSLAREDTRLRALRISDEIVSALKEDRIVVALQPLVRATTGTPVYYEALMRLRRPDGELSPPAAILPTAEKSGLIQMIDERVIELSLKKLVKDPELRIAVNVSGQTLHDPDYFARLSAWLGASPDVARRLTVEFTETSAIEDVELTTRIIATLKSLGARVAMDDFGAGHTSFRNLRRFGFDQVKIDGAFVQNLARSDDRFFVRTLIDLARHVGVDLVAEWVEDRETADLLRDWGVDYLQGDYFGAARVAAEDLSPQDLTPQDQTPEGLAANA